MYQTFFTWGETAQHDTLPEAFAALRARFPDLYAIHEIGARYASPFDTEIDFGEDGFAIVVWETEQESIESPGASSAIAQIYYVDEEEP